MNIANGNGLIVGHTALIAMGGDTPEFQVAGTDSPDAQIGVMISTTTAGRGAKLTLARTRDALGTFTTALSENDMIGQIRWAGSDTTDATSFTAFINSKVDGAVSANDMPGRLEFHTTPDSTQDPIERMRIDSAGHVGINTTSPAQTLTVQGTFNVTADGTAGPNLFVASDGNVVIGNNSGLIIGHTAQVASQVDVVEFQILGTAAPDTSALLARWSDDGNSPRLDFAKSRDTAIGSFTIVQDNDIIGLINFVVDDGTDFANNAVQIRGEVDDASPAGNDIGGQLTFLTHPGGGGSLTERLHLAATGAVGINDSTPTQTLDIVGTFSVRSGQSGNAQGLYQNPAGNVGIGTTTPDTALHIIGNVTINNSVSDGTILFDSENDAILFTGENGSLYQPVYGTDDGLVLYLPFSIDQTNISNQQHLIFLLA